MVDAAWPALTLVTRTNPGFTSLTLDGCPSTVMCVLRLIPTLTVLPSSWRTTTAEPLTDCTTPCTVTVAVAAAAGGPPFVEGLPRSAYDGAANANAVAAIAAARSVFDPAVTLGIIPVRDYRSILPV